MFVRKTAVEEIKTGNEAAWGLRMKIDSIHV